MQLRSLSLNGFRRFAKASVNLESNVIAIVGRNEAGKSTLLEALRRLNNDEPIPPTALSDGGERHDEVIRVRFRLSDEERKKLGVDAGNDQGNWLILAKPAEGQRRYRLDPPIARPLEPRAAAWKAINNALANNLLAQRLSNDLTGEIQTLRDGLDTDQPDLSDSIKALFASVPTRLGSLIGDQDLADGLRKAAEGLLRALESARAVEETPSSDDLARSLAASVPQFLPFHTEARELRSSYQLAEGAGSEAFRNLCAAAEIPYQALLTAMQQNHYGKVKSILDAAERKLADILETDWTQPGELRVGFVPDRTLLNLQVTSSGSTFHSLDDRSEGLRTFIALRAFLTARAFQVRPVLLVDEAETHLHYDAQADLIRMFEQQRDAACIIYTTHSIGCLPQDLGRGVRVVIPLTDGVHSKIENAWTSTGGGVTPLMRAMGSAMVPLAPSRHVAMGEGPSDPLLLPSLLREVNNLRSVPFQVVGRLSEASDDELRRLRDEAQHVAFVMDGDASGEKLEQRLLDLKVPKTRITRLPAGLCLEDLVDPARYVAAVNKCLTSWPPNKGGITEQEVGSSNRPAAVKDWCKAHGLNELSHQDVAEEIVRAFELDDSPNPRLVDLARRKEVATVYRKLLRALKIKAADAALYVAGSSS